MTRPAPTVTVPVDDLAQEIRRVDGNHDLGAGALAEALVPFLSSMLSAAPAAPQAAGVGEVETIARAIDTDALLEDSDGCVANPTRRDEAMAAARRVLALRAPSREPEGGAVSPLVRRLAYGYAIMHQAICHMAGTSGASGRWYYDKANEAFGRVSPIHAITESSNPHVNGDYFSGLSDFLAALATREEAPAEATDCKRCAGNGEIVTDWDEYLSPPKGAAADHATTDCPDCDGIGKVEAPAEVGEVTQAENPGGYLIKDFADGWFWTPHRIAAVAALTDGHAVYDLRAHPQAREDAQPVAWLRPDTLDKLKSASVSMMGIQSLVAAHETKYNTVSVYTHPAPDALRETFEDIKSAADSFRDCEGDEVAHQVIIRCDEALAALQAEQKGGA